MIAKLKSQIEAKRKELALLNLEIGADLKAQRKARGVTQKFVALEMGVSNGQLCDLENGRRPWTDARIAAYRKALNHQPK